MLRRSVVRAVNLRSIRALGTQEAVVPDVNGIEKRWGKMKELDQADVIDYLAYRSQGDWNTLTTQEQRALYYISFGNWGPRSEKAQVSISGTVLRGLFGGVLTIAVGVAFMNYAFDLEREEKVEKLLERIEKEK